MLLPSAVAKQRNVSTKRDHANTPFVLNKSHPLAAKTAIYQFYRNNYRDLSGAHAGIPIDMRWIGGNAALDGISSCVSVPDSDVLDGMDEQTIHMRVVVRGSADASIYAKHHDTSTLRTYRVSMSAANIVRYGVGTGGGTQTTILSTSTLTNDRWYTLSFTYDGVNMRLYVDGVEESSTAKTGTINSNDNELTTGCRYKLVYEEFFNGEIEFVHMLDRAHSADEVRRYVRDPYQVLSYPDPISFYPVVAGGVTVNIPVGALSLTGQIPTIDASANLSVDVPVGALNLTGQAPTVVAGGDITVSIPLGSLDLTGQAPTALAPSVVDIPLGALSLSAFAPTVDITDNQDINIPVGALSLLGFAPVAALGPLTVDVPVGALSLTGFIPGVSDGLIWTVQADDASSWSAQADSSNTWTIQ